MVIRQYPEINFRLKIISGKPLFAVIFFAASRRNCALDAAPEGIRIMINNINLTAQPV